MIEPRSYTWTSPDRSVTSSQPALLYRELSGGAMPPTSDHVLNVLNFVGGAGWELAAGPITIDGATRLVFKRLDE